MDSEWQFWTMDAANLSNANTVARLSSLGVWTDASSATGKVYRRDWRWRAGSALETIRLLDIGVYGGRGGDGGEEHVSPTAENWRDVTGLCGPRTGLAAKDLAGLALMGVKQLYGRIESLEREVAELRRRIAA